MNPMDARSRRQFLKATGISVFAGALEHAAIPFRCAVAAPPPDSSLVAAVRYLGSQFLDNGVNVTGADGATSVLLPSGESLWVFGDTVEGPFETIRGLDLTNLRSNTAALVPQQDASHGIKTFRFLTEAGGRRPRQILPFTDDENPAVHRVWAVHGTWVGTRLYLYYHRISLIEGVDVFVNFQLDGMGIARAQADDLQFTRLLAPDGSREFWKGNQPGFGVFVERANDYVYLWGSLMTGMYLARTRPETIEDLAAYEYLVAAPTADRPDVVPSWSKEFDPAGALFDSVPNEMSSSYNAYLKRHVVFHSHLRENKIVMRTAPRITGPWSASEIVYRPERIADSDFFYAAKEHPELSRENGRVLYVTFVNSSTYVPQMIEVTLK